MRLVVTGHTGFVGSNVTAELERGGHVVLGVDKSQGDDVRFSSVAEMVIRFAPQAVIHIAGSCSTVKGLEDPVQDFSSNALGTVNMLDAARRCGAAFHYTSSAKAAVNETNTRSPYGLSKRVGELYCQEFLRTYGTPIIGNRPGTIYGAGQEGSPESGWIAWFVRAKEKDLPVTIDGDGLQERDLLHVSDYAKLVRLQVENWNAWDGTIYTVGGGPENTVTVLEVAKALGLRFGFGPARVGDHGKIAVASSELGGWSPRVRWSDWLETYLETGEQT